ncbi:MAG TPA: hypothetical protein VJW94_17665 [Candidatus Acidoferrum sp.]|nr:hypothetical protein [Candidatus Acidoferrum sp.]
MLTGPVTAYLYDWNTIPLGQILWLEELESYGPYPPMQDPETYNLIQVSQQIKNQNSISHAGEWLTESSVKQRGGRFHRSVH